MSCAYCGGTLGSRYPVTERMLGTAAVYAYRACASCGARAITAVPVDLAACYPPHYGAPKSDRSRDKLRAFRRLGVDRRARIVDVGASHGAFLYRLAERGYTRLLGVDPYAPSETTGAVTIRRAPLESVGRGQADVLTMHHVFEHVEDPAQTLRAIRRALSPGGKALLRVPLADSWAAREYGADWVQHDAPRHLTIPTTHGLAVAARRAGLRIVGHWRDEGGWQGWASAEVAKGRCPWSAPTWRVRAGRLAHELRAHLRNRRGVGDQGVFVLAHGKVP